MNLPRVLTSGCFDGLHDGHRAFFSKLRQVFVVVDVALASDEYIIATKGRLPRCSYAKRAASVSSMRGVNRVFQHDMSGAWGFLPAYDVFVKGRDWADKLNQVPRGIHVCIIDSGSDIHTSDAR